MGYFMYKIFFKNEKKVQYLELSTFETLNLKVRRNFEKSLKLRWLSMIKNCCILYSHIKRTTWIKLNCIVSCSVMYKRSFLLHLVGWLAETAWIFSKYFNVASNFNYGFLILLRKLSCENVSLLYSTFVKLLERFIKVLAAILGLELLLSSLSSS